jgi:type IV pilus assembly protein PilM
MLGIDIGNRSIKIVDANVKKNNIEIKNFAVELIPPNVIDNDRILDHDALVQMLKNMIIRYQLKGKANFVLCSPQVMIRDLEVTYKKESELAEVVNTQIEQILPGISETSVIDYRPKKDGKVMVCAAPADMIKEYADIIMEAGLKLQCIDVMCNSVGKLFGKYMDNLGTEAIVDIGHSKLDVTILVNGEISLNKTFNVGNAKIDELIANYYNLSLEEADRVKRTAFKGYNVSREDLDRYLRFSYEQGINEIKRLIQYFDSKSRDNTVSQVTLTGGGTLFDGIDNFFQEILEIPTKIFKPTPKIKVDEKLYLQNIIYYIPALGATIREDK